MKIAFTGGANTGKTTLATELAKVTGLPLIEERFERIVHLRRMDRSPFAIKKLLWDIFEEKKEDERKRPEGFIADRMPIDLFSGWCSYPELRNNHVETLKFYDAVKAEVAKYDVTIIIRWGSLSFRNIHRYVPGVTRPLANPWMNLHRHTMLVGLAYEWLDPSTILRPPPELLRDGKAVDWIIGELTERNTVGSTSS